MCKVGKDGVNAKTPCHGLELVSACIGLFTAVCIQNPENLKTLLSIEMIPEVNYYICRTEPLRLGVLISLNKLAY